MVTVIPDGRFAAIDHPLLRRAEWLLIEADRYFEAIPHENARILMSIENQDGDWTNTVDFLAGPGPDELDDLPGVRRIERRAGDLVPLIHSPWHGAWATMTIMRKAVIWTTNDRNLVLASRAILHEDGWESLDLLSMRTDGIPLTDLAGDARGLYDDWMADKLGPGRLADVDPVGKSVQDGEGGQELRVVVAFPPGAILCHEDMPDTELEEE